MRHATSLTLGLQWLMRPEGKLPAFVLHLPVQNDMQPHDHLFHEIMLVEAGTGVHVTAAGYQRLRPGDLFVIRPQVWHAFEQTRRLSVTNLLIAPELLRRFGDDIASVPIAFDLFRRRRSRPWCRPPTALHARPAQRQVIRQLMWAILREQSERQAGWRVAVAGHALHVLVATSRLALGQVSRSPLSEHISAMDRAVQGAADYLESHFDQRVSLEQLADHCSLSSYHLSRHFNRCIGMGINAYQHRLRAEEACRLLRGTNMEITAVAMKTGYDDVSYFSRCFRRQTGVSPRAYRRTGRHDSSPP